MTDSGIAEHFSPTGEMATAEPVAALATEPMATRQSKESSFREKLSPDSNTSTAVLPTLPELRALPAADLPAVCGSLRRALIDTVASSGGHFAAGLGVVELTVALHYVFDTPTDALIWDVGHQCYPHKLLTGRQQLMKNVRKLNGPAGFPVRGESPYDSFGVAHAGTSISAGLGMAKAFAMHGSEQQAICVIGDGALTEGMAFEALNHAGASDLELIIVLNDNAMSISPNVGALSQHSHCPKRGRLRRYCQSLGLICSEPVDGHDVVQLTRSLTALQKSRGIRVLHTVTQKGKGYAPAEQNPVSYHAVPPFDPQAGVTPTSGQKPLTYTDVFGQWLCDAARADERVIALTPAMREGSGLVNFEKQFPQRYVDVGIAEQHAVTFAAGLACQNTKPVVAIYSSFLQRAYDQAIHDVALQNLDVLFAIDRAGLVGADGATHHGSFDLSYLRCIPNMLVMAPANERECRAMLQTGLTYNGPAAVRYERGAGPGTIPAKDISVLPIGKADLTRSGHDVAILSFGGMLQTAHEVAEQLDASVANMRFIKPLDETLLTHIANSHRLLVTIENNAVAGGAGSAVNESLSRLGLDCQILNLGLPDSFVEHGTQGELLQAIKIDTPGILASIDKRLNS